MSILIDLHMIVSVLIHWYYVAAFRQQCNAPLMGNTHVPSGEYVDSVQASHSPEDLSLHTHIYRLPIHHSYYFSLYFLMYNLSSQCMLTPHL